MKVVEKDMFGKDFKRFENIDFSENLQRTGKPCSNTDSSKINCPGHNIGEYVLNF